MKRWQSIISQSKINKLQLKYVRYITVVTNHRDITVFSDEEFSDMLNKIRNTPDEHIMQISFEPNTSKIRKEVKTCIENLFSKYFDIK